MADRDLDDGAPDISDKPEVVKQAIKRLKLAIDAEQEQRQREVEDLEFQDPDKQWTGEERAARAATTVAGVYVPELPTLAVSLIDQPIQLISNQERAAHLGVTVQPLDEDADDETAETLQGLYRRIEVESRADLARTWGFDRSVKCGRGWYRVLTEYCDEDGDGRYNDQRIKISRILHQASIYADPFAEEPDWSDGEWLFEVNDMALDKYQRKYGKSKVAGMSLEELRGLGDEAPGWVGGSGASTTIRVAQYWWKVFTMTKGKHREIEQVTVKVATVNAVEEVEPTQEWNGKYIPFVPTIGRELQPINGKRMWVGVIRPSRGSQRMYNWQLSTLQRQLATATQAPYIMANGQQAGLEGMWAQSAFRAFPFLLYEPTALNGATLPPPQRTNVQMDTAIQASLMALNQAKQDVQSTSFFYDPSLGKDSNRALSGKAKLADQQQGDSANSNYLDNLARISMPLEAKIVMDLIPHVYDRPGRIERILGIDDKPQAVMLNAPYTIDKDTKQPKKAAKGAKGVKHFDLKKGRYGVNVSVGKSYQTRMQEGSTEIGQILQADPALMPIIGPTYFKFQPWPGAQEIAKLLEKVREKKFPGITADEQDGPSVEELQGKLQQAGQMVQMMTQELQAKTQAIETDKVKSDATLQKTDMEIKADLQKAALDAKLQLDLQQLKNDLELKLAQLAAGEKHSDLKLEAQIAAADQEDEQRQESAENALDRELERELAEQKARQAEALAEQQAQHAAAMAEQQHGHNLEATEQQAKLAPKKETK